jgi:rubrerythrin
MDIIHFSAKEVLEMAIRIEENGVEFYTQAGNATKFERLKELFIFLAKEEKKHIACFEDMDKRVKSDDLPWSIDPYLEEESLYLKALANSRVFTNTHEGKRLANEVHTEQDVLQTAINMEKDSILFYYELHNAVRDKDKAILRNLIEEEKSHLRKLTELQKFFQRNSV